MASSSSMPGSGYGSLNRVLVRLVATFLQMLMPAHAVTEAVFDLERVYHCHRNKSSNVTALA